MGVDPISLGFFAIQAFSAIRGFRSRKKEAKATRRANEARTKSAQEEARFTREDSFKRAKEERRDAARIRSAQMASFLQSGVTLDGSPLLVTNETTQRGEESARNITENAEFKAKSILRQGEAGQVPVQKADIFGTAATVLGAAKGSAQTGGFGSKAKARFSK